MQKVARLLRVHRPRQLRPGAGARDRHRGASAIQGAGDAVPV